METSGDILDENINQSYGQIPVFLKVLCILTFVGSGLGILGALMGFVSSGMTEESMRISTRMMQNTPFGDSINFEEMMRWQVYTNWANLIGSLLTLAGGILMWKLRKIGYYLYIPGWIIPVAISAIGMRYMLTGMFAGMGFVGIAINVIFAAAFIIMYGLNYKHLK